MLEEEKTLKLVGNGSKLGFRSMVGKRMCGRDFEALSWRGGGFIAGPDTIKQSSSRSLWKCIGQRRGQ